MPSFWRKLNVMEYANIILAVFAILLYYSSTEQIDLSRKTAKIELRAYLQIVNATATQMAIGKTLEVTITYKNTGQTPAYNVNIQASIKPGGNPIDDNTWLKLYKTTSQGSNVLGSNFPIDFTIKSNWFIKDSTTIPAWESGGKYFGVYGIIHYEDIFGLSHWNRFYFYWQGDKFVFGSIYNDADKYEKFN
jgi:uncharacterized repeat protein (TIGR01451 family)